MNPVFELLRRTVEIDEGYICSGNDQCLSHDQTETSCTASDDSRLAFEGERGEGSLEVEASAALDGFLFRHSLLIERDLDRVIGSGERTNVLSLLLWNGLLLLAHEGCDRHVPGRQGKRAGRGHHAGGLAKKASAEHDKGDWRLSLLSAELSRIGRWYNDGEQRKSAKHKAFDKLSSSDAWIGIRSKTGQSTFWMRVVISMTRAIKSSVVASIQQDSLNVSMSCRAVEDT